MSSTTTNRRPLQKSHSIHELRNFVSSIPTNPSKPITDSILHEALPPPLAAPPGWQTEIIRSNS